MGGWTQLRLKDRSKTNIEHHNQILDKLRVPKQYRFHHWNELITEWEEIEEQAEKGITTYPYWYGKEVTCYPHFVNAWEKHCPVKMAALYFDCYFGRTSDHAMSRLAQYVVNNWAELEEPKGSFSTFVEKAVGPRQKKRLPSFWIS